MSIEYFRDDEGDLNLNKIFTLIWEYKLSIFMIVILSTFLSIISARFMEETWTARAQLMPVEQSSGEGGTGSALMSMIGMSLTSSGIDTPKLVIAIIESKDFFKYLIEDEQVLIDLMAVEKFEAGKDIYNDEIYNNETQSWTQKPSFNASYSKYKKYLNIQYRWELGGFIFINFDHSSPIVAQNLLIKIITGVNEIQRQKDITDADNAIKFLEMESMQVSNTELKKAITSLMENHLRSKLFARTKPFYVVEPVDSVYLPNGKSWPNVPLIVLMTSVIAFFVSIFGVVLITLLRK